MIAGKRGVPRADMSIDTLSYFKPLEQLSVLRSENQRYYHYLSDFTSALRRKYISADPLLDDIAVGKRLSRSWPTHSAFLSTVDSEGIAEMLYPHINSHIFDY